MIDVLESPAAMIGIGLVVGITLCLWVVEWLRCEGCCQHDDHADFWLKKLGRRKEDRE